MSNISGQLIKDSFNYVLQSDLTTGVVYRIGGAIPVNPTFLSGLTVNSTFTFVDGSENDGYVLTSDAFGNATWKSVTGTSVSSVSVGQGLSGNSTTGAITIINTAPDQTVTITGGTNIEVIGVYPDFGINFTGTTASTGDYLPLSGGTVTGDTTFQQGLTATTISGGTFYGNGSGLTNVVISINTGTGLSGNSTNGNVTLINTAPDQIVSLTGGTGINITGTYPNFTVVNTSPSLGGTVNSVGLSMPSAFTVTNSPITSAGTLTVTVTGATSQLIDGTGALQSIPTSLPPSGTAGGDLNGVYPNPTVDGLQGNPVSNVSPVNGQVLQWNGSAWIPGAIPTGGSGGGGVFYYFNYQNTSGITPTTGLPTSPVAPSQLGINYSVGSGSTTSADLPNGSYALVCGFVTISGTPGITDIPGGLWDFNIWVDVVGSGPQANQTQFQVRVYKYTSSAATYTSLANSDDVYIYDPTTIAQYIANVTMPQTTILSTDRIYIELWAQKNVNQSRQVRFYFDSLHPSHVHTTIPSVAGTGVVKVVNGVFQSPATLIFNDDVDAAAAIDVSKLSMSTNRLLGRTTGGSGSVEEISLTTSGSSGSSTLSGTTLNIPTYTLSGLGGVPSSRTISTTSPLSGGGDLSADRTFSISQAGVASDGYLSSTDWGAFNNKPTTFYQNTIPTGTGTSAIIEKSIWTHSDTGLQYTYIYDGDSYQWVQQTLPVGPQGPQGVNGTNNIDSGTTTTFSGVVIGNGVVLSATSITNVIGYTPENTANKETVALDSSNTKYPTNNVVNTALQSFSDDVDYATMINQRILFNY